MGPLKLARIPCPLAYPKLDDPAKVETRPVKKQSATVENSGIVSRLYLLK
jgi:hypothetical protein